MNNSKYICEIIPVYKPKKRFGFKRLMSSNETNEIIKEIITKQVIEHYEVFGVLFLNTGLEVVGYNILTKGCINASIIDIKLLFQNALLCNASRIIVFHNHPSGLLKPSFSDIEVTKKIKKASKLLEIDLVDSIIVTKNDSYSILEDIRK